VATCREKNFHKRRLYREIKIITTIEIVFGIYLNTARKKFFKGARMYPKSLEPRS
jgi:hypothetical protein